MDSFVEIELLGSFAMASATVLAVTEAIKKILKTFIRVDIDNRIIMGIALALSIGVVFGYMAFKNSWSIAGIFIGIANALAVFGSATAGFKAIKTKVGNL